MVSPAEVVVAGLDESGRERGCGLKVKYLEWSGVFRSLRQPSAIEAHDAILES